jgi:hypothetical protein
MSDAKRRQRFFLVVAGDGYHLLRKQGPSLGLFEGHVQIDLGLTQCSFCCGLFLNSSSACFRALRSCCFPANPFAGPPEIACSIRPVSFSRASHDSLTGQHSMQLVQFLGVMDSPISQGVQERPQAFAKRG